MPQVAGTFQDTGRAGHRCAEAATAHPEFLAFLLQPERAYRHVLDDNEVPVEIHPVMNNYAAGKRKNVRAWLAWHPRSKVHFTPTHASWMNLVEVWSA